MADIVVYKNRTNVISVSLGSDVSGDTFESEIREKALVGSPLIATWDVAFLTDGADGELVLTLDDSAVVDVTVKQGYMDIKRTSGGEPYEVFAPIKVLFKETVTE
jgi:hypothetical protein